MPNYSISLLTSASRFYESLFEDIRGAVKSVRIQMYCIEDGATGAEFQRLLIEKAQSGIVVDLMYDSIGSLSTSGRFFDEMSEAGVTVIEYHPIDPRKGHGPFSFRKLFRRNHRKLILIDSRIYYLGGMNIGDRFSDWEDLMIRGEGEPLDELILSFDRVWGRRSPIFAKRRKEDPDKMIQVCDGFPKYQSYPIKRMYISAIKRSKKRVWIAQAYFVPRRKIVKALIHAARKGVDVRIIMPDVSDVKLVDWAAWPVIRRLLKHGAHIYRFKERMMHSKFAIIDDHWLTAGTANLDSMSLYWNLEINLVFRDTGIVSMFADLFSKYEKQSRMVDINEPKRRPLALRALGRLLYYYSWIL